MNEEYEEDYEADEEDEDERELNLPTIDEVIPTFFSEFAEDTKGVKAKRVHQVHSELRAYLESEIDDCLTSGEATVLAAEREFDPSGAACRVLKVDLLLAALPGFIREPHLAEDLLLRRAQLDLIGTLAWHVLSRDLREVDASCLQIHVDQALSEAHRDLKRERRLQLRARREAKPEARAALEAVRGQLERQYPNEEWPPAGCTADELRAAMRRRNSAVTTEPAAQARAQNLSAE